MFFPFWSWYRFWTFSFPFSHRNFPLLTALVSKFAGCSSVVTWALSNFPCITSSLTEKKLSSICSVLEWSTGLWESITVLRLSQYTTAWTTGTFNSSRRDWSHMISAVASARLRYSAFVLERATRGCFLDHQDTRLGPRNTQVPDVDLLSSTLAAQSASWNPLRPKGWFEGDRSRPWWREAAKYLRILLSAF